MEKLSQVLTPSPDQYFWYVLATLLAGALIWILARYVNKQDKFNERIGNAIERLTRMTELHEWQINELNKDVDELKKK